MELLENATDSEDELPEGYEERVTPYGRVYYANHATKTTQWEHPITNKQKYLTGELPYGWEKKILDNGTILFVDNINKKTSYTDPRLAYEKYKKKYKQSTMNDEEGKQVVNFDENSTADELIKGRDYTGFNAVVTGANRGVGLEIAKSLALHGCYVIVACRNVKNAQNVFNSVFVNRPDVKFEVMELDLSSLKSVKRFADKIKSRNISINMLFLNAAVLDTEYKLTEDNIELMFQVNHLAQFYLVRLLTREIFSALNSRIVIISCEAHRGGNLSKTDISSSKLNVSKGDFHFLQQYCNNKLCNLLFANELNRRLNKMKINNCKCKCNHPGNLLPTKLFEKWTPYRCLSLITTRFAKVLSQAAAGAVLLGTVDNSYFKNEESFYWNGLYECEASEEAQDSVLAYRLWEISEALLIDRTSAFDSYLSAGDELSSYTKPDTLSSMTRKMSSIKLVDQDKHDK